jgi:hypothetical protein
VRDLKREVCGLKDQIGTLSVAVDEHTRRLDGIDAWLGPERPHALTDARRQATPQKPKGTVSSPAGNGQWNSPCRNCPLSRHAEAAMRRLRARPPKRPGDILDTVMMAGASVKAGVRPGWAVMLRPCRPKLRQLSISSSPTPARPPSDSALLASIFVFPHIRKYGFTHSKST